MSEAAYGNGVPFYLSFFFRREELALRTGLFISAAPLATSFASSLAWLITKLGSYGPIAPWRLLFLVEGFPSTLVAVFAWHFVPDTPSTTSWLTTRERKVAVLRLRKERETARSEGNAGRSRNKRSLDSHEIWQTLADPKSYLTAVRERPFFLLLDSSLHLTQKIPLSILASTNASKRKRSRSRSATRT